MNQCLQPIGLWLSVIVQQSNIFPVGSPNSNIVPSSKTSILGERDDLYLREVLSYVGNRPVGRSVVYKEYLCVSKSLPL